MKVTEKEISIRLFGQQMGVIFLGAQLDPVEHSNGLLFEVEAIDGMKIVTTKKAFDKVKPGEWAKPEYMKLINIIKPYLYRHRYCGVSQLAICDESEYEQILSLVEKKEPLLLRSVKMLIQEAANLTPQKIKFETLWNAMHTRGRKLVLPGNCKFHENRIKLSFAHFGQAYGCDADLGSAVLSHLLQNGLLHLENDMVLALTFEGLCEYEQHFSSQETKEIFVVQPYELPMGDRFNDIIAECRRLTNLVIEPVWTKTHNEKIDERILRKIERCGAILVYVDNSRFNVGFECGYALARGKQVICVKPRMPKRPSKSASARFRQPFDISTLNTTEYDETDWQSAANRIAARLSLAVGDEIPID